MAAAAAAVLGEDGRGYELARKLDGCGAWRAWLGDAAYTAFAPSLSSPSSWESFMSPSSSSSIHLQLRARALLFDKASASLFLPTPPLSDLNPTYLQLHGDDIFFSLEEDQQDVSLHRQMQPRPARKEQASNAASRYNEPENTSQRHIHEELPETWYSQCAEKYRAIYQKFPYADKDSLKRTSEGMLEYMKICEVHKRKRQAFKGDQHVGFSGTMLVNGSTLQKNVPDISNSNNEEITLLPEIMFPSNCVPDSALPLTNIVEKNQNVEFYGVLDNLPTVVSRSTAMMERFGIRPEYIKVGSKYRGKDAIDRKPLGEEQASLLTRKVVARSLLNAGFEGGTEVSVEVFSEVFSNHICSLGRKLKLLADSYKKRFSSIELLKMFLQITGNGNLGALIDFTKDGNKGIIHQTPQHVRAVQTQHQNSLLQAQQLQRQMHAHPQMNMLHPQNLAFQQQQLQQQQQQLRRRQGSTTPRGSVMLMDKDQQPMADVKTENMMESSPMDATTFNALNKQHQLQLRQQQLQQQQMAMGNHHAAQSEQFRQLQAAQMPQQFQAQNAYTMRTPPVKVEAFHELMGGDSTMKHEPDHKLTSPSK